MCCSSYVALLSCAQILLGCLLKRLVRCNVSKTEAEGAATSTSEGYSGSLRVDCGLDLGLSAQYDTNMNALLLIVDVRSAQVLISLPHTDTR